MTEEIERTNRPTPTTNSMKDPPHCCHVLSAYMKGTPCIGSHDGSGPENIFPEAIKPVDIFIKLPLSEQDK